MPPSALPAARTILIAGLLILSLSACGRRGPLEAPMSQAELAAQQQGAATRPADTIVADEGEDAAEAATVPVPVPTARRRSRGVTVPKEPFILDPLL
jgi:predicted small lipoprotein YifL